MALPVDVLLYTYRETENNIVHGSVSKTRTECGIRIPCEGIEWEKGVLIKDTVMSALDLVTCPKCSATLRDHINQRRQDHQKRLIHERSEKRLRKIDAQFRKQLSQQSDPLSMTPPNTPAAEAKPPVMDAPVAHPAVQQDSTKVTAAAPPLQKQFILAQDPKTLLEKLEQYPDEQKLQIISDCLQWMKTSQATVQKLEMYKQLAEERNEEIVELKVQLKLQAAGGSGDPALQEENSRLQKQISDLKQQLAFQTKRSDDLGTELQSEHETSMGLAAQVRSLNEQIGNAQVQLDAMQAKLDANIAAKRELEQKLKDNEKSVKASDDSEKRITELRDELHKKEAELKRQIASMTEWQSTAKAWEEKCIQLQSVIDNEQSISAQAQLNAMQKKLDANIAAKRELEQKLKENDNTLN